MNNNNPFFRLDRLLSVLLFYPLIQKGILKQRNRIPILMYHSISEEKENGHPYFHTHTAPAVFAQQLQCLSEQGYAVVSLETACRVLNGEAPFPEKAVVITFDDGFRNVYTEAAPLLERYGFTATVFLPAGFITEEGKTFKGTECMSWRQVRELHKAGFAFGSHTVTHPELYRMGRQEIVCELKRSKETIEWNLGAPVEAFSYPYAFPDHDSGFASFIEDSLREIGYRLGVTTRLGTAMASDMPYFLKRIPVNCHDDPAFLGVKLSGGYDWLYPIQKQLKRFKNQKNCTAVQNNLKLPYSV